MILLNEIKFSRKVCWDPEKIKQQPMSQFFVKHSTFENYNKKIEVEARGFNSDINNKNNQTWSGYHAGISLANNHSIFNFEFDARYENQEGLIDKAATFTANLIF